MTALASHHNHDMQARGPISAPNCRVIAPRAIRHFQWFKNHSDATSFLFNFARTSHGTELFIQCICLFQWYNLMFSNFRVDILQKQLICTAAELPCGQQMLFARKLTSVRQTKMLLLFARKITSVRIVTLLLQSTPSDSPIDYDYQSRCGEWVSNLIEKRLYYHCAQRVIFLA